MPKLLSDKLRVAILRSKKSRFLAGADMRLTRAEKIAAYLGLQLR